MAETKKVVRLAPLRDLVAGQIEDNSGKVHDVRQLDFDENQRLAEADGTANGITAIRNAVKRVVPTMSDAEIGTLTTDQAQVILTLAGAGMQAVEKLFPNVLGSETA